MFKFDSDPEEMREVLRSLDKQEVIDALREVMGEISGQGHVSWQNDPGDVLADVELEDAVREG